MKHYILQKLFQRKSCPRWMALAVLVLKTITQKQVSTNFSRLQRSCGSAVFLLLFLLSASSSWGQSIFTNPITGTNPNTANPYTTNQVVDADMTVSGIGRGTGIGSRDRDDSYYANNFTNSTSLDSNDYFQWTLTPNTCKRISFTQLALEIYKNGDGPRNLVLRSSLDNYASNISITTTNGTVSSNVASVTADEATFSLTANLSAAGFQNVNTAITFRLYGYNGEGTNNGNRRMGVNNFTFGGTVTSLTSAGTLSGTQAICSTETATFSSDVSGGTWSSSNGAVATINSSTGLVSGVSAGTATMTYTVTSNGCSGSATRAVTINISPNITGQPADQSVTTAQTAIFTVTATGTSLTYQWQVYAGSSWANITNGGVYSNATTASLSITNPSASLNGYKYRCVVSGTCSPTATSNGNATLAVTLNYCSPTFTTQVVPITNVTFNTINNSSANTCTGGTSLENFIGQSTTVIVQQSYTLSVSGTTCGNYTDNIRAYFDWNGDGDFSDAGESYDLGTITNTVNGVKNLSITIPATASLGVTRMRIMKRYNGYPTGPCQTGGGFGQAEDYGVIICANPTISSPTANATVTKCSGENTSFSVTASSPAGAGATTYQWQVNTGTSYTNISNGGVYSDATTATLSLTGVTTSYNNYLYRCVVSSGCGGSATSVVTTLIVNSLPTAPTVGSVTHPTCSVATGTFQIIAYDALRTYTFTPSTGVIISGTGLVTAPAATYTFTVNNAAGCTSPSSTNIVVNAQPATPAAPTVGSVTHPTCSVATGTFQIIAYDATRTYTFTPSTGVIISGTGLVTAPAGTYTFTVNNAAGCTSPSSTNIVVNAQPATPVLTTSPDQSICAGSDATISASGATSYEWSNALGTASSVTVSPSTTTTYTVTGTAANGCTNTVSTTVTVNPIQTALVSIEASETTICSGTSVTFTATPTNGGTTPVYQWKINGSNVGTNSPTFTSSTLATGNVVSCVMTSNAPVCLSGSPATSNTVTMTVNPNLPASVSIGASAATICSGTSVTFTATPTNGGTTPSYQWKLNGSNVGTDGATYTSTTLANGNTVSVVMTSNASPCLTGSPATSNSISMIVDPTTVGGTITGGGVGVCQGATPSDLTLTGQTGSVLRWEKSTDISFSSPITIVNSATVLSGSTIGGLEATTYFRAVVQSGICAVAYSDVTALTITSTTWNGSQWSDGAPDASTSVLITGNFTATSDLYACNLTVSNNASVMIPQGYDVILSGALTVGTGSTFTLEHDSNLTQTASASAAVNTGKIIVKEVTPTLMRQDYVMFSSPVIGQQLQAFSPNTLATRFYTYNPSSNIYSLVASPSSTNFATGKGYLIRTPNNHPTTPTLWTANYEGTPFNGNLTIPVTNGTYNAIGNPYPSAIDADMFFDVNGLTEALYFYRKTNGTNSTAYATYTKTGGVSSSVRNGGNSNGNNSNSLAPNGLIAVGQGFIVKAASSSISFTNAMRMNSGAGVQLRSNVERHRVWLSMTNTSGFFSQTLVAYMTGATNGIDAAIDGRFFNDSQTAFTSMINGQEYAIQGRQLPFVSSDVVAMGFKTELAGTYSINLDAVDGIFLSSEVIYLKDKLTNTYTNMRNGSYTFSSLPGVFNDRFELRFAVPPTFYQDADGDGYGSAFSTIEADTAPVGYVANSSDCDDALATVNLNATEVLGNGIDDNCDGITDEATYPASGLISTSCGVTLTNLSNTLFAHNLTAYAAQNGPIQGYRFEVSDGQNTRIYDSAVSRFNLLNLPGGATYGTTYSVRVSVKLGGFWRPYGTTCSVTTPAVPNSTSIVQPSCGSVLVDLSNSIFCNQVAGATGYRFRVRNGATIVGTYDSTVNRFSFMNIGISNFAFGVTYSIDVLLKFGTTWRPDTEYGSVCTITSPSAPPSSRIVSPLCGSTIASYWTSIFAQQITGAEGYRFEVSTGGQSYYYDSVVSRFNLRNVVGLPLTANTTYSIRVSVLYNAVYYDYGSECAVTTAAVVSRIADTTSAENASESSERQLGSDPIFVPIPYPNPFVDTFRIAMPEESGDIIHLLIYDLGGKLIAKEDVFAADMESSQFGSRLQSGDYLLVISQGASIKSMHINKR